MDTVLILWIVVIFDSIIICLLWGDLSATKNLLGGGRDRIWNLNYLLDENKRLGQNKILEALRKRHHWLDYDD